MASNFLNSSGTDLDDLFYVNNSNDGALGFLMYNGQDLGNRYPSGSLGYSVGYKNSAGTDIGYLRGNIPPIGVTEIGLSSGYSWDVRNSIYWVYYYFYARITGGIPPYTVKCTLLSSSLGDTGSVTKTVSYQVNDGVLKPIVGEIKGSFSHSRPYKVPCTGTIHITDSTGATYSDSVSGD